MPLLGSLAGISINTYIINDYYDYGYSYYH